MSPLLEGNFVLGTGGITILVLHHGIVGKIVVEDEYGNTR